MSFWNNGAEALWAAAENARKSFDKSELKEKDVHTPTTKGAVDSRNKMSHTAQLEQKIRNLEMEKQMLSELVDRLYAANDGVGALNESDHSRRPICTSDDIIKGMRQHHSDPCEAIRELVSRYEPEEIPQLPEMILEYEGRESELVQELEIKYASLIMQDVRKLAAEKTDISAELDDIKKRFDAVRADAESNGKRVTSLIQQNTSLAEENAKLNEDKVAVLAQLRAKSRLIDEKETEIEKVRQVMHKNIEAKGVDTKEAADVVAEAAEIAKQAQARVIELEKSLKAISAEKEKFEHKNDQLCEEMEQSNQIVSELRKRLEVMELDKQALVDDTRDLSAELERKSHSYKAVQAECTSKQIECDDLKDKLRYFEMETIPELEEKTSVLESQIKERDIEISKADNKIMEIEAQAQIKLKSLQNLVKDLKQQLQKKERQEQNLQLELRTTQEALAAQSKKTEATTDGCAEAPPPEPMDGDDTSTILLKRLAVTQEKVWHLQGIKESYELEMKNMAEELERKSELLLTYFFDPKTSRDDIKHNQSAEKVSVVEWAVGGVASAIGMGSSRETGDSTTLSFIQSLMNTGGDTERERKMVEAIRLMQSELESCLADNIRLKQQNSRSSRATMEAERKLERAIAAASEKEMGDDS